MGKYVLAFIIIVISSSGNQWVFAQENMCESVQNHIKTAKSIGGDVKAKEKASLILGAHKYLKKSITEPELVRCILLSGVDPNYVKAEAVSAGIPPQTVEAAYIKYNMSLPPEERAAISLVRPLDPAENEAEPESEVDAAISLDVIATDTIAEGGVSSGPGCNQISPWTWCAY